MNIKSICTQCQRLAFIFSDNVGILYMYPVIGDYLCFIIHGILYLHIHTLWNNKNNSLFDVVVIAVKINIMSIDCMFTNCTRKWHIDVAHSSDGAVLFASPCYHRPSVRTTLTPV
jgi:hypothetical protein